MERVFFVCTDKSNLVASFDSLCYHPPMETTIYLVRHGETEWNRLGLIQGHLESNLTKEGLMATKAFKKEITALNPDVIYSSDQPRAVKTAQILTGDLNRKINLHSDLREINFGVFQGHNWDYIEREMKHIHNSYVEDPDYIVPGGESHNQFNQRAITVLENITQENRGKKILIVSHGGTISKMLFYAKKLAPSGNRYFRTKNLALNVLKWTGEHFILKTSVELVEY